MKLLWALSALLVYVCRASASTAGFIKSPLSGMKVLNASAELHCEVIGNPIPEVQWWFVEGEEPNETFTHLFDGARDGRVEINATYVHHASSTILLTNLTFDDTGTYECRASNDPDRNSLRKAPKVKWIRSQANVIVVEMPTVTVDPPEVVNQTSAVLTCNLTGSSLPIKGSKWLHDDKLVDGSESTADTPFTTLRLEKITSHSGGKYHCVFLTEPEATGTIEVKTLPHVGAYKHSEHGNERDKAVITCVSHSYPLPTDWSWFKVAEDGSQVAIANGTSEKYLIKSTPEKTSLLIENLNIEEDIGEYACIGTNEVGSDADKILLRVRSRFAALWPFLGIVAEVIILVTIIFIYEKRRKPDEVTDDDDSGSAPLKSNSTVNHKDKNVRQRNSN